VPASRACGLCSRSWRHVIPPCRHGTGAL